MTLSFTPNGWEEYLAWQTLDKKMYKRINLLIQDILRNPFEGIGKPEALKHDLKGFWSRRITEEHRIVYTLDSDQVTIIHCMSHYRK